MQFNILESIYIISAGIGTLASLLGVMLGGVHFHSLHTGHSIHTGHTGHTTLTENIPETLPILNIQAIFAFMIGFGSAGLISFINYNSSIISLVFAIPGGLIGWYIIRALFKVILKNQSDFMTATLNDALGHTGTVVSKIFPNAIGEVMCTLDGASRIIRAKSDDSKPLEKGEKVVILTIENDIATVVIEGSLY